RSKWWPGWRRRTISVMARQASAAGTVMRRSPAPDAMPPSGRLKAAVLLAGAAQGHQHGQQLRQPLLPRAAGAEAGGDALGIQRDRAGCQNVGHGAHLFHGVLWPWRGLGSGDRDGSGVVALVALAGIHGIRHHARLLR